MKTNKKRNWQELINEIEKRVNKVKEYNEKENKKIASILKQLKEHKKEK